jgi:hypothetical protein
VNRPTHATASGSAYLALQKLAKERGRPTDELLQLYVLERFLARVAESSASSQLVLKGGVLLAAFDVRRPTRDIDFAARQLSNDLDDVVVLVREVLELDLDDGVTFERDVTVDTIRDDDAYSGARASAHARVSRAKVAFHIDLNFGDPIHPAPSIIELPSLIGPNVRVLGYPVEMVLAEKLITALDRGTTSTRWRDFADIWALVRRQDIAGDRLYESIRSVAAHRDVVMAPLSPRLDGYADLAQARWAAWRSKVRMQDEIPLLFDDVLGFVCAFADPALDGSAAALHWRWDTHRWS